MSNEMNKAELLSAISEMLDERFAVQDKKLDKRFANQERYLMNSILEEVDRVQEKANIRFERIEKRLDNIEIMLRTKRTDLEYRVLVLERKLSC